MSRIRAQAEASRAARTWYCGLSDVTDGGALQAVVHKRKRSAPALWDSANPHSADRSGAWSPAAGNGRSSRAPSGGHRAHAGRTPRRKARIETSDSRESLPAYEEARGIGGAGPEE